MHLLMSSRDSDELYFYADITSLEAGAITDMVKQIESIRRKNCFQSAISCIHLDWEITVVEIDRAAYMRANISADDLDAIFYGGETIALLEHSLEQYLEKYGDEGFLAVVSQDLGSIMITDTGFCMTQSCPVSGDYVPDDYSVEFCTALDDRMYEMDKSELNRSLENNHGKTVKDKHAKGAAV
jgi:hypothetical protein